MKTVTLTITQNEFELICGTLRNESSAWVDRANEPRHGGKAHCQDVARRQQRLVTKIENQRDLSIYGAK